MERDTKHIKRDRGRWHFQVGHAFAAHGVYTPEQVDGIFLRGANQGGSRHVYPCCFCERWLLSHGRARHLRSEPHQDRKHRYYLKTGPPGYSCASRRFVYRTVLFNWKVLYKKKLKKRNPFYLFFYSRQQQKSCATK